ncbi:hypothetical protein GJ496_006246, partial [Pomphorhynchus laevis]
GCILSTLSSRYWNDILQDDENIESADKEQCLINPELFSKWIFQKFIADHKVVRTLQGDQALQHNIRAEKLVVNDTRRVEESWIFCERNL